MRTLKKNALKRSFNRGFTLFELMMLVSVISIITTMAVPQLRQSMADYRLVSSANLLAIELNSGRAMAISRASVHQVTLDAVNNTIQITDLNDANNAPRMEKFLDSGITFSSVPDPTILFYGRGLARGETIEIQNEFGTSKSITVTASGKVTIG